MPFLNHSVSGQEGQTGFLLTSQWMSTSSVRQRPPALGRARRFLPAAGEMSPATLKGESGQQITASTP